MCEWTYITVYYNCKQLLSHDHWKQKVRWHTHTHKKKKKTKIWACAHTHTSRYVYHIVWKLGTQNFMEDPRKSKKYDAICISLDAPPSPQLDLAHHHCVTPQVWNLPKSTDAADSFSRFFKMVQVILPGNILSKFTVTSKCKQHMLAFTKHPPIPTCCGCRSIQCTVFWSLHKWWTPAASCCALALAGFRLRLLNFLLLLQPVERFRQWQCGVSIELC